MRFPEGRRRRLIVAVATAAVLSLVPLPAAPWQPAAASHDGLPVLGEAPSVPQSHRPQGGGAVRIYGEGFLGTTSVKFGVGTNVAAYVEAPDFRVVDGDLIIATVPSAPAGILSAQNDGFAHIRVTDDQGAASSDLNGNGIVEAQDCVGNAPGDPCFEFGAEQAAIFYTDANLTLSPSTGLDHGEMTTMTLTGHRPNQSGWPFVHVSPLINFLEDGPPDPDAIPFGPPYGTPLAFAPTNASGNAVSTVTVTASPTFNAKDQDYDADADCPVAQITADHGLDRCLLGYSEFGMASIERQFSYSPDAPHLDPVAGAPILAVGPTNGAPGATVTLNGTRWNAAPHFGSDTTPNDPGETPLTVEVCNTIQTSCTPAAAQASVAVTRYFDSGPEPDAQPVTPLYTGATLSGTFTVPNTGGCAPSCIVRVRQQRFNIDTNAAVPGDFITATAELVPGGTFAPLSPARIWDSRVGPGPVGQIGPGQTRNITVTGLAGVPVSGASSVVLNVTAVAPNASTFITAWPAGETKPLASNLNVPPGDVRPNLVVVKVGAGGQVSFYNDAGSVHLIADVAGWYGANGGQRYTAVSPSRVWDSRFGPGPVGQIGPGQTRSVTVAGLGGVPITGVTAVVLNVTAVGPTASTFITAWPAGETRPLASNLNVPPGDVRPNLAIVKLGAGGQVNFYNDAGSVHLIADVAGYYTTTGSSFFGVSPARVWDSRFGPGPVGLIGPNQTRNVTVTNIGGVPASGVTAVVLNVTAVGPTAATFIRAWPAGELAPLASNLNVPPGDVRANLVVVKVGSGGQVSFDNNSGSVHLIADVAGWYGAAGA